MARQRSSGALHAICLFAFTLMLLGAVSTSGHCRRVDEFQPGVKWGGRSVAVTLSATNNRLVIVATESGGLFRSADGGGTWSHLDGLPPFRMSDVRFAPSNDRIVIATTKRDSHKVNGGGIWLSIDGGDHWQRPTNVDPPSAPNCPARSSAFGIAFQQGTNRVFVGTDCGLAISPDLGSTWSHVVPDPQHPAVGSVVAPSNGSIYICGDGGPRVSQDPEGATWGAPFDSVGSCARGTVHGIDFSPEAHTVFVTGGSGNLVACNSTGTTCTSLVAPPFHPGGRPSIVRVSPAVSPSSSLDVYFGVSGGVFRQTCTISSSGVACTGDWGSQLATGHSDTNDLAFATDRCPHFVVTDGGVQTTADCGNTWTNVATGPAGFHALGVYDVAGQIHPDQVLSLGPVLASMPAHTDLYFGTQDNGLWASADGGATWPLPPTDPFDEEGGGFQLERRCSSEPCRLVAWMATGDVFRTGPQFAATLSWTGPPGNAQGCATPTIISKGIYIQFTQIAANAPTILFLTTTEGVGWNPVLTVTQPLAGCPWIAGPAGNPTVYAPIFLSGLTTSMGDPVISLLRITGVLSGSGATATQVGPSLHSLGVYPMGDGVWLVGQSIVLGVSHADPLRLIAADIDLGAMVDSFDGGQNWVVNTPLTKLVTANGSLQFNFAAGDAGIRMQPHVIAFDPDDDNHIVVGTEAAGLIESTDGGASWNTIKGSDRVTAVSALYFNPDRSVVVATYGRGLWKISDGKWNPEEDLGGILSSGPDAASWGFDRIDIFYRGQNQHLWHKSWDGAQWNNEVNLGGVLTSDPAVASWSTNRLDIFYRGQNQHLWHKSWDGAQWNNEVDLGGVPTSDPAVASWGLKRLDVFYRGQNEHLWHRSFSD
jgi:hypothetical protein